LKYYRVVNWEKYFEFAQSRKVKGPLSWVAITTKLDGRGLRRIQRHPDKHKIFTAWVAILQVAAKRETRGVLVEDGHPLDSNDLADKTGWESEIFDIAFSFLTSDEIRWLEIKDDL